MNDLELVAAAKGGDQGAFLELHQRHIAGVKAIAWSILETDDVDDVCQEIFLKAFNRIGGFKGNSQFETWLTSIAQRECLRVMKDRMRPTKGSYFLVPLVDLAENGDDKQKILPIPQAKEQFVDAEKRADLIRILSSVDSILPPKSRLAVKAALGGATMQQIAKMLGVPLKTAESRFTRLLRRIEKIVSPN